MHEGAVVPPHLVAQLPNGLQEGQALDVADRAPDLDDDEVGVLLFGEGPDAVLDLVRDVWNDLHGLAQELAPALLGGDRLVHRPGCEVGAAVQALVCEPLVVAQVQVGLRPVVQHVHLAMLERVHGPGIDVDVRVELLEGDAEASGFEQPAQGGGGDSFSEAGGHSTRDEDELPVLTHLGI